MSLRKLLARAGCGLSALLLGCLPVHAQEPLSPVACDSVAARVSSGTLRDDVLGSGITTCGATGVNALATALRNSRTSSDASYLWEVVGTARHMRASGLYTAAVEIAGDARASARARAASLVLALDQAEGVAISPLSLGAILESTQPITCKIQPAGAPDFGVAPNPLPTDASDRLMTLANPLASDAKAPQVVRWVAACVREGLIVQGVLPALPTSAVSLTYVCGNNFRIANTTAEWLTLRYDVESTSESGGMEVGPSETVDFSTEATGTVRVFRGKQLLQTKTNRGTKCTS